MIDCIRIARAVGSDVLSIWLADGTNYPGQDDIRGRQDRDDHLDLDTFENGLEGLPEHALVRYHLARAYAALERHDDAKAQFAKAAELVGDGEPLGDKIKEALGGEGATLN